MSEPFIGEIRIFGFSFPPRNWALCDGQLMAISQNQALFSLLGTNFGGDGRTTFKLPDFRGRVPVHRSLNGAYQQGLMAGEETETITSQTLPAHSHLCMATSEDANRNGIGTHANRYLAQTVGGTAYGNPTNLVPLDNHGLESFGGSISHNNMQPYQVVNFSISLTGLYPSRP